VTLRLLLSVDQLHLREVPDPRPDADEILVRVLISIGIVRPCTTTENVTRRWR
jgi:hypothetical protein